MSARIVLVRHGRSAHPPMGWLAADGVRHWLAGYDAAGLTDGEQPPPALRALAERADRIVASDLRRALASAALLAPGADVLVSPLLREMALTFPAWRRVRLPRAGWAVVIGARWIYGTRRGRVPSATAREQAVAAAAWLAELAGSDRLVLAVTHGVARGLIADALAASGWVRGVGRRRYAHWSAWPMLRAPETSAAG